MIYTTAPHKCVCIVCPSDNVLHQRPLKCDRLGRNQKFMYWNSLFRKHLEEATLFRRKGYVSYKKLSYFGVCFCTSAIWANIFFFFLFFFIIILEGCSIFSWKKGWKPSTLQQRNAFSKKKTKKKYIISDLYLATLLWWQMFSLFFSPFGGRGLSGVPIFYHILIIEF